MENEIDLKAECADLNRTECALLTFMAGYAASLSGTLMREGGSTPPTGPQLTECTRIQIRALAAVVRELRNPGEPLELNQLRHLVEGIAKQVVHHISGDDRAACN